MFLVLFNIKEIVEEIDTSGEKTKDDESRNAYHQHSEIKYILRKD